MRKQLHTARTKPPILWTGVVFALAANLLLSTVANMLVEQWQPRPLVIFLLTFLAPMLAGLCTAFYVRQRGGMHAFIGGLLSIPFIALFILVGFWQLAVLSGALCTLGGVMGELFLRRRG